MSRKSLLIISILCAGSMWYYVQLILVPYQQHEAASSGRPRGNLSDLYPRWLGSRELLLRHRDPYSPEVTREIQMGYYGRALDSQCPTDPKDQEGFAYPVYVAFLLSPLVTADFKTVMVLFSWMLVLLTIASVFFWERALRYKPPPLVTLSLILLTLGSFQVVQGIKLQQLSLLVGGLIAACAAALTAGYLALAGLLLGLVTIKPQLALPIFCWLALWSISKWKLRRRFLLSFLITGAALVLGGEWILPGWISRFRAAVHAYMQYTGGRSLLQEMAGGTVGTVLMAAIILFAAFKCWQARHAEPGSRAFSWTLALILATTVAIVPTLAPYNHVLLLPGLMMAAYEAPSLWRRGIASRLGLGLVTLAVAWPWLASIYLFCSHFLRPPAAMESSWKLPLYAMLAIPLAVLAIVIYPSLRAVSDDLPAGIARKSGSSAVATHTPS